MEELVGSFGKKDHTQAAGGGTELQLRRTDLELSKARWEEERTKWAYKRTV